jgi:membrane protease YdiL (CAAX protease family)
VLPATPTDGDLPEPPGATPQFPEPPAVEAAPARRPWQAWFEIVLCSGYPTQLMLGAALQDAGIPALRPDGSLSATFVFALSLGDTAVLIGLMWWLLVRNGERPREVFLGRRRPGEEVVVGVLSVPFVVALVLVLSLAIRAFAPFLRNVPENPLEGLLGTQTGLLAFLAVVIVAGGLREELQRAFLLHRFRHDLGSAGAGLVVTSIAFGLGHTLQGWDAAILTGALGFTWGAIYLTRGSAIATVVSHSLFNSGELLRAFAR